MYRQAEKIAPLLKRVVRSYRSTDIEIQLWNQATVKREFSKKNKNQEIKREGDGMSSDLEEYRRLMEKSIDHLHYGLANIRMGRATTGMLDHLKIEAYGEKLPMKAVGTVSVKSPQLLSVNVFDTSLNTNVAKSIAESPLGLNPKVEGQEVLVPIPPPTHETLEVMKKLCKSEAEAAKVSIRHIRKLAMSSCAKSISCKDERYSMEKFIQSLTNGFTDRVDEMVKRKTHDIEIGN